MNDSIKQTRIMISNLGGSELKAMVDNETLQQLFDQKQKLIAEMNLAKRAAAAAAAAPYLEAIKSVDETYAIMLTLATNNPNM